MDKKACSVLSVDIGAGSGKIFAASFDGERIDLRVIHHFSTAPLMKDGYLINDIEAIYQHIIDGFQSALSFGSEIPEILCAAIDTFGNDYVLLRDDGKPMIRPVNYRDTQTLKILRDTSREEQFHNYKISGILPAPSVAHYQLLRDMARLDVREAESPGTFLMLSDYFGYRLTNKLISEYTISSTTGLVDVQIHDWSEDLLDVLPFRRNCFLPLHEPGQIAGELTDSRLKTSIGERIRFAKVPGHDSACAVIPIPMRKDSFFLSSGSWFILGMETTTPYLSYDAFHAGISNQGFLNGSLRVVRPMPGLWIMQKCLEEWRKDKMDLDFNVIEQMAANYTGPIAYINIQRPEFLNPGGMLEKIYNYCRETEQEVPNTIAGVARSIYISLALLCKKAVGLLNRLSGVSHNRIYLVGGGARDSLLATMIADATFSVVLTGFQDAAAIGNTLIQLVALKQLENLEQARQVALNSFSFRLYEPHKDEFWDKMMNRAIKIDEGDDYEKLS
jgi:sugar (pentulose or hexulose) kinase